MIEEIKKLKLELININRKLYEQAQDIDGNKQGIVENKESIDENKQGIDGNKQFIVSVYITVFIGQIDRFYIDKRGQFRS